MKARLVDLIGSSGIENATSAQPKNLASAPSSPPFRSLGEWLGTRLHYDQMAESGAVLNTRGSHWSRAEYATGNWSEGRGARRDLQGHRKI